MFVFIHILCAPKIIGDGLPAGQKQREQTKQPALLKGA